MATTPVRITLPTSGLTATLVLYDEPNGTVLNTPADTLTQVGSTGTQYEADVTEAIAGLCYAEALSGTTVLASGYILMADDTTVRYVQDYLAATGTIATAANQSTILSNIATAQADLDILTDTDGVVIGSASIGLIWDEVITRAAHNVPNSAAKYLRQIKQTVSVTEGTISGTPTSTAFDTDLTQASSFWTDALLVLTTGAGAGQSRPIISYDNTNGRITLDEALSVTPSNGDEFVIASTHIHALSQLRTEMDASIAAYDPPTRTEATADKDAVLAAISALNDLDSAAAQAAAAAALAAYDGPTRAEATSDKDEILAAVGTAGSNDYNLAFTVDDGTDPLASALVRVVNSSNATVSSGNTDANGQITLTANAGDYTVLVTLSGYTGVSQSLTVSADATVSAISLTANTLPTVDADQSAGSARLLTGQGVAIANNDVRFRLTALASGEDAGLVVQDAYFTLTTDGSGYLSGTFIRGATYQMRVVSVTNASVWTSFEVPDAASFTIPALVV